MKGAQDSALFLFEMKENTKVNVLIYKKVQFFCTFFIKSIDKFKKRVYN